MSAARAAGSPPVADRLPAGRAGRRWLRPSLIVAVAAAVVAADQATKSWALSALGRPRHLVGPLWLTLTFNTGAAFGIGRGVTPVVEVVVVVLVVGLVLAGRRAARRSLLQVVAVGMLLGGALGNLTDRVVRTVPGRPGAVVDFIDALQIGNREWWPVFNVADACIVVGAVLLAVSLVRSGRR